MTLANKDVNQAGRTKLDRERLRSCMREMVRGRVCRGSRFGFFEGEPSTRRSPDEMKLVFKAINPSEPPLVSAFAFVGESSLPRLFSYSLRVMVVFDCMSLGFLEGSKESMT